MATTYAHCPNSAELCESCRDDHFTFLRGTAACRGSVWASSDLALAKVHDLTGDAEMRDRLARVIWHWAAKAWRPAETAALTMR